MTTLKHLFPLFLTSHNGSCSKKLASHLCPGLNSSAKFTIFRDFRNVCNFRNCVRAFTIHLHFSVDFVDGLAKFRDSRSFRNFHSFVEGLPRTHLH